MSSTKDTVSKSSRRGSKTGSSTKHQSSETLTISLSPVHLKNTRAMSTWLQQVFPANHSQWQGRKEAKTTKGTSGRKRSNVFAMFDPVTHSWRTSQVCLILDTSAKSSLRWPKQGSMLDGVCSEQTMWVPRIEGNDSGLWPTPRANSAMAATMTAESAWAENRFPNLETVVGRTMWPTPTVRDYKGAYRTESLIRKDGKSRAMDALPNAVLGGKGTETASGQLNPTWVEWLMGWPLEWTGLKPLETDRFHLWLQQHGRS